MEEEDDGAGGAEEEEAAAEDAGQGELGEAHHAEAVLEEEGRGQDVAAVGGAVWCRGRKEEEARRGEIGCVEGSDASRWNAREG